MSPKLPTDPSTVVDDDRIVLCVRNEKEWEGQLLLMNYFERVAQVVLSLNSRGDGKYSFSLSLFLVRPLSRHQPTTLAHLHLPLVLSRWVDEVFNFSPKKKTSPLRSTNTLWQFNYNIPFFQLVLFLPIFPFPCFLQRCCYFPITLTRLRWHWCVHVYTVCSSVHQQAIHVVSHTCKERKEENENEKSSFRSQLFNYVWQLEIFCLFLSSDSVGEWKWESSGREIYAIES